MDTTGSAGPHAGVSSIRRWPIAAAALALALLGAPPARGAGDMPPPPLVPEPSAAPASAPQTAAPEPADSGDVWAPAPRKSGSRAAKPQANVTIEQKHVGRRVSQLVVTPAGFTYSYTLDHLDGMDAGSVLQPHPELSTPRFFRFDF
jgi:hypothetical protein